MSQLSKILSNNISRLRSERGLTQQQLADLCEFSRGTIAKLEAGASGFHLDTLQRLAKALNIEESALLQDQKEVLELALIGERAQEAMRKAEEVQEVFKNAVKTLSSVPVPAGLEHVPVDILEGLKEFETEEDFDKLRIPIESNRRKKAKEKTKEDHQATRTKPKSTA